MKFGIVFPGFGNQFVGLGKDFYDNSRIMQEYFEEAASCLDKNFVKLCFASSEADIAKPENGYVALFLVSASIAAILKEHGIEASVVAGKDIGEYAALLSVGGISLPDAVYLLNKYAQLYQTFLEKERVEGLRVKNVDFELLKKISQICVNGNKKASIASYELENQAVLTGSIDSIACIKKELEDKLIGPMEPVFIGGGLHSPQMDEILKTMKVYLEKVDFKDAQVPFMSSITGQALKGGDTIRAAVMQQIHAPLQWKKVMDGFAFCDTILVAGPSKELVGLFQTVHPEKKIMQISTLKELNGLLESLGKAPHPEEEESDQSSE